METDVEIQKRIDRFKSDLSKMHVPAVVRKYITFGDCYILDSDKYFDLKAEVAEHFDVHTSEVLIVGSAKLGFSIAPDTEKERKRFGVDK